MSTLNNNKISYFAPRGAPTAIKTAELSNKQAIRRTTSQALQRTVSVPAIEMVEGKIEVDALLIDLVGYKNYKSDQVLAPPFDSISFRYNICTESYWQINLGAV